MSTSVASMKGVTVKSLDTVTTGTGIGITPPISTDQSRVIVRGAGTISGGTVIIEEADNPTYSGTWSQIQSVTASTLTGNAELVIHIFGTIGAIRGRISSDITGGGTITVELVTN